jgi:hypothetical protein
VQAVLNSLQGIIDLMRQRQGKPPGYDTDCLDLWIKGSGFGPDDCRQAGHPLKEQHV